MLKVSSTFDSVGTARAGRIYVPSSMVADSEFIKLFTFGDEVEIELKPELGGLLVTPKNETILLNLSNSVLKQLEQVRKKTGARNIGDVLKNALATYDALKDLRDRDGSLIIEHAGKRIRIKPLSGTTG